MILALLYISIIILVLVQKYMIKSTEKIESFQYEPPRESLV